jgi:4-hydroxy-2-oxoglutarate aldolase
MPFSNTMSLYRTLLSFFIDMDAATVIKLASHPNIIGLKDSGGNVAKVGAICHKTKDIGFQACALLSITAFPGNF